jgi:hypothetical protein
MYFQHAINNDPQTRLLNVLGPIAMILGDKKKSPLIVCFVGEGNAMSLYNYCLFCISYFS